MPINAKDDDGVIHQVMVRASKVEHGKTRCQRVFKWPTAVRGGVIPMEGSDEKVSCILCLGHWSAI